MKIFIVEDDPIYRELLSYHLSLNPDYEIEKLETGKKCLDNIHLKPDIVSIDYSLPDMDGKVLIKQLKQVIPGIPVIVLSGQKRMTIATDFIKLGAVDYIKKEEDLIDQLDDSLEKLFNALDDDQEKEIIQFKNKNDILRVMSVVAIMITIMIASFRL